MTADDDVVVGACEDVNAADDADDEDVGANTDKYATADIDGGMFRVLRVIR